MVTANELFTGHLDKLKEMAAQNEIQLGSLLSGLLKKERNVLADLVNEGASTTELTQKYKLRYYEDLLNDCLSLIENKLWPQAKLSETNQAKLNEAEAVIATRNANLAKGRPEGVKARQAKAEKKKKNILAAIAGLFDKPEKPGWGWTNSEIVGFLVSSLGYSEGTISPTVKREAAKYRKARKEEQARKYLNR